MKTSFVVACLVSCAVSMGLLLVTPPVVHAADETPMQQANDIASRFQEIELGGGFNGLQLIFLLVILLVVWVVAGDKIKKWWEENKSSFSFGGRGTKGVEGVYQTLLDNGFTEDEAEELVQENWSKIRKTVAPAAPVARQRPAPSAST